MKIKSLLLAATALLIGFTSCSKDGNDGDNGVSGNPSKNVYIKIDQDGTRAETGNVVNGTTVKFRSGYLLFTNSLGEIRRFVEVVESSTPGKITAQDLINGYTIEDVHESCTMVRMYANLSSTVKAAIGTIQDFDDIADINAIIVDLADMTNATCSIANVPLFGEGVINDPNPVANPMGTNNKWAEFDIAPLMSRIEIDQITAEDTGVDATTVAKFNLTQIFINYHHEGITLDGRTDGVLINNGQDHTKYAPLPAPGTYNTKYNGILYDVFSTPYTAVVNSSSEMFVKPGAPATTWAYNVIPTGVPHVIFRLTDVEDNLGAKFPNTIEGDGVAYLTVTGYKVASTQQLVDNFVGGNVYKFSDLSFNMDDLGEVPERKDDRIEVDVIINVMNWNVIEVDPIID